MFFRGNPEPLDQMKIASILGSDRVVNIDTGGEMTKRNPHGLVVGQEVVFVSNDLRKPETWTIAKIGRDWATTTYHRRFHLQGLFADGGKGYSSDGIVFPSQDDYETYCRLYELRDKILDSFQFNKKLPGIDVMEKVAALLGVEKCFLTEESPTSTVQTPSANGRNTSNA